MNTIILNNEIIETSEGVIHHIQGNEDYSVNGYRLCTFLDSFRSGGQCFQNYEVGYYENGDLIDATYFDNLEDAQTYFNDIAVTTINDVLLFIASVIAFFILIN